MSSEKKMFITDLDGTLLNSERKISDKNVESLKLLKEKGFVNVIATGRSIYSTFRALDDSLDIDYLVFSSGSGILNWKTKEIILTHSLKEHEVEEIANVFLKEEMDFSIHYKIPDNHCFDYFQSSDDNEDFNNRIKIYNSYAKKVTPDTFKPIEGTQFIAIENLNQPESKFNYFAEKLSHYKVVRATSPLDHKSVWVEVFHKDVSKANACKYLADMLNVPYENTIGIGNDYNDMDLLNWTNLSYMVKNAPEELKKNFNEVVSNDDDGVGELVNLIINE